MVETGSLIGLTGFNEPVSFVDWSYGRLANQWTKLTIVVFIQKYITHDYRGIPT